MHVQRFDHQFLMIICCVIYFWDSFLKHSIRPSVVVLAHLHVIVVGPLFCRIASARSFSRAPLSKLRALVFEACFLHASVFLLHELLELYSTRTNPIERADTIDLMALLDVMCKFLIFSISLCKKNVGFLRSMRWGGIGKSKFQFKATLIDLWQLVRVWFINRGSNEVLQAVGERIMTLRLSIVTHKTATQYARNHWKTYGRNLMQNMPNSTRQRYRMM